MPWSVPKVIWLLACPVILVLGILTTAMAASPDQQPAWLLQAREEALQGGYELLSAPELKALYASGRDFTIIDVRPEYEYREGHLSRAKSLEFDLGDKLDLKPDKQEALVHLMGPEKSRLIVFYCRSFA